MPLLMRMLSDVASERLPVLHIRLNLPQNYRFEWRTAAGSNPGSKKLVGECMSSYSEDLRTAALAYHRLPRPGKLEIQATKPLANQRDLALA